MQHHHESRQSSQPYDPLEHPWNHEKYDPLTNWRIPSEFLSSPTNNKEEQQKQTIQANWRRNEDWREHRREGKTQQIKRTEDRRHLPHHQRQHHHQQIDIVKLIMESKKYI